MLNPNNSKLYVGDHSLISRFLPISKEFLEPLAHPYEDVNLPIFVLKTSLFEEWEWLCEGISFVAYWMAMILNIIIITLSLFSMIKVILTSRKSKRYKAIDRMFFIFYMATMLSFIMINIKLPYGCTMNFRYIVPTIWLGLYFIVRYLQSIQNDCIRKKLVNIVLIGTAIMIACAYWVL